MNAGEAGEAVISEDGRYRYVLRRHWDTLTGIGAPLFVMLNPSTADADKDDATIRRCRGFAVDMGHAGFTVVNLYAFRATRPADLWPAADPVGPDNDDRLRRELEERTGPIICAWGSHAKTDRVLEFVDLVGDDQLRCLGRTLDGAPRHPLYVKRAQRLEPWSP